MARLHLDVLSFLSSLFPIFLSAYRRGTCLAEFDLVHGPTQPRLGDARGAEIADEFEASAAAPASQVAGRLISTSAQMREVLEMVTRVADTDVTVLVRGESGTGKALVARAVHAASPRRARNFVKVNCATLPSELLDAELFGFERGAFTSAIQHKPGKFEFANQGTLYLDEISEIDAPLQ